MSRPLSQHADIVYEETIQEYMKEYIKGQEKVLDLLSYVGHLYTVRLHGLNMGWRRADLPKVNMLITGPTGYGKTFSIKKLAEALELPYIRIDCSSVTAEGWKGTNLSTKIAEYVAKSPWGAGIVHLDEFDKMGNDTADNNDTVRDSKAAIQQNMLDLLDGEYSHSEENNKSSLDAVNNALVILTGSFQSARNIDVNKKKSIGFIEQSDDTESLEKRKSWKEYLTESGFMHEFASRIICSIEMERYTDEQIKDIIVYGNQSTYHKYYRALGVEAAMTHGELDELVKTLAKGKNGLRDLDSLLFEKYYKRKRNIE